MSVGSEVGVEVRVGGGHNCFLLQYYAVGYVILFVIKMIIKKRFISASFTTKHDKNQY